MKPNNHIGCLHFRYSYSRCSVHIALRVHFATGYITYFRFRCIYQWVLVLCNRPMVAGLITVILINIVMSQICYRLHSYNKHILSYLILSYYTDFCRRSSLISLPMNFWRNSDPFKRKNIFLAQKSSEVELFQNKVNLRTWKSIKFWNHY